MNAVCHAVPKTEIRIMSGCDSWQQSPVVMVAVFLDRHSRYPVGATTKQTDNIFHCNKQSDSGRMMNKKT